MLVFCFTNENTKVQVEIVRKNMLVIPYLSFTLIGHSDCNKNRKINTITKKKVTRCCLIDC